MCSTLREFTKRKSIQEKLFVFLRNVSLHFSRRKGGTKTLRLVNPARASPSLILLFNSQILFNRLIFLVLCSMLGKVSRKKVARLFGFCPNYPLSPKFGQLVQLFLNAKNVNVSDIQIGSFSKNLLNTCFMGHIYNLKNS